MATNVILPALGIAQDTGKIIQWYKAEGESVTQGEPLVEIETDKAAVDLEAPTSGILAQISAMAGDEVPVAQVIAVILSPAEAANASSGTLPPPSTVTQVDEGVAAPTRPSAFPREPAGVASSDTVAPGRNGLRTASPKARRMAAEHGLDIMAINGTGPGGVVLAADIVAATTSVKNPVEATTVGIRQSEPGAPVSSAPSFVAPVTNGESTMSTVWRIMAERTTDSWTSVPHFFLVRDVNAAGLIAWRERAAQQVFDKVTYTDLLIKIVAEALRRHPRLNASWANGAIVANDEINVGLAVATEDGLVVPVIHQADDLSLKGIARQRVDLVARAQAGRLKLPELQDGTFTISNLGMYGIDAFNAIINAPQAAILAVGRIVERVTPVAGQPAVQPMMTLTLSCDHRVVDGARGAQFLSMVAELIENPSELSG